MGEDGGTKVSRSDMVRVKSGRAAAEATEAAAAARWTKCAITGARLSAGQLSPPVSCDASGVMFQSEAMLMALLSRSSPNAGNAEPAAGAAQRGEGETDRHTLETGKDEGANPLPPTLAHVSSRGDILGPLQFTSAEDGKERPCFFRCAVSGAVGDGTQMFACHAVCGCVVSARALRHAGAGGAQCPACGADYTENAERTYFADAAAQVAAKDPDAASYVCCAYPGWFRICAPPNEARVAVAVLSDARGRARSAKKRHGKRKKSSSVSATGSSMSTSTSSSSSGRKKKKSSSSGGPSDGPSAHGNDVRR